MKLTDEKLRAFLARATAYGGAFDQDVIDQTPNMALACSNEVLQLRETVKRLRKDKRRLKEQLVKARQSPDWFEAQGNRGGSFIRLSKVYGPDFKKTVEGMVRLEVGETCVVTVKEPISVAGLAAILTHCRDRGFQTVVNEYLRTERGTPDISIEHDLPPRTT